MHLRLWSWSSFAAVVVSGLVGCGGGGQPAATGGATKSDAKEPATLDEQLAMGEKSYVTACASCHGEKGEGKAKAPALIGPKGFDDYKTTKEAYDYIKGQMPSDKPGSLSDPEYWAITAYLAKKNNYPVDKKLDAGNAASFKRP